GEKLGFLIGKYGVDLFAAIGSAKMAYSYQELKRANQVLNLESMSLSAANKANIESRFKIIKKFEVDQLYIKQTFGKKAYPEQEIRKILKEMGYQIPPRPKGIPENFYTSYSKKGCG